jgi:hypothetical protein
MMLTKQAGQMLSAPIADPSKNPNAEQMLSEMMGGGAEDPAAPPIE